MSDDVAVVVLVGRFDPGHQGDVPRDVERSRIWEPKKPAADAIVQDGLVTGAKSGIRRPGLRRQNAPHVGAIGLRAETATVGGDRQAARARRRGGGVAKTPVTHPGVSEKL